MTDDDYAFTTARSWIRSGYYTPDEVSEMLLDILEESDEEAELTARIDAEFAALVAEQTGWPAETDCDRLDRAFESLTAAGIIALQNTGTTMSDGHSDVGEVVQGKPRGTYKGYCFFHGQDVDRVVSSGTLYLAFGDLRDTPEGRLAVGRMVRDAIDAVGLRCEWDETIETRIVIRGMDWKRRLPRS